MAINRVPVLKRCRSLGLDPIYLGIDKKSNRQLKRANRKVSEYGLQLREKQKAKFIYGVLELSLIHISSERVSEAPKGPLRMDGNHPKRAKPEAGLTATPTGGAGTKVGLSDPVA